MKIKPLIPAAVFFFLFAGQALAQTSIKAEVDKTGITTDENIIYKVTVTSLAKKVPGPELPKFEGFYILSQAQSSTISLAKGKKLQSILVYVYILVPKETGKFKIEPSRIKVDGKAYVSGAFEIEVKPGTAKPQGPPSREIPSSPEAGSSQPEQLVL
jgi:hypothetical protein